MSDVADIGEHEIMHRTSWKFCLAAACLALPLSGHGQAQAAPASDGQSDDDAVIAAHEGDRPGVIDYGYGVGVRPPAQPTAQSLARPWARPRSRGQAHRPTQRLFRQPAATLPGRLSPLHVALLPDGRVMNFGTTEDGNQGGFVYDVWDPAMEPAPPRTRPAPPTVGR